MVSFKKTRALEAKVELTTDLKWLGQHGESHVATVQVDIVNKGAVRLHIDKLEFAVRGIARDSTLQHACQDKYPRLMKQLYFPEEIAEGSFFPADWDYAFVDPGCTDAYRHPISIPKDLRFVMIWVKLWYPDDVDDFQHEQHFCAVPLWKDATGELRNLRQVASSAV